MYRNKELWSTIGAKLVSSMSYYKDFEFSEDEVFELIADDQYLLDDSIEVYGKELINFLRIWELIRLKIIESKETFRNEGEHKWSFDVNNYREVYMLLDSSGEYEHVFLNMATGKNKTIEMIIFFEESLIEEASLEAFIEDLLITYIYFAIEKPLGVYTIPFLSIIANSMLLYRGFGPILPTYKGELLDFCKLSVGLLESCKGLPIEHYNRTNNFDKCFKRLLDISENNKMILDAI
ncbi:hypothetical protein [Spiroplasma endosymbiont of Diplazon laetatorius]|uniref:hypothetical protein n=1 Tax=Spiroplasma endosymbiont of Diplazon laetatorius TaxID=3066322 RepID=UPI0030D1D094